MTMSEPSAVPETFSGQVPSHRRRRWLKIFFILVLLSLPAIAIYFYHRKSADRELADVIAELDRSSPGWRLDDVLARRPLIPAEQNSATIIRAAHKLLPKGCFIKMPDIGDIPPPVQLPTNVAQTLGVELKALAAALAEARKLSKYPNGRLTVVYAPDFISTLVVPEIQHARAISELLKLDCWDRLQKGDLEGALTNCRALLNTARVIGDEPFFISQLVRIAIESITIGSLERTLAQGEVRASLLAETQKALEEEAAETLFRFGALGERGGLDRLFRGLENGTLPIGLIAGIKGAIRKSTDPPEKWNPVEEYFPANMIKRSHAWVLRKLTEAIEADKLKGFEKYQALKKVHDSVKSSEAQKEIPALAKDLFPALFKVAEAEQRTDSLLFCAVAALAAEQFRLNNKRWPKSLDELVQARLLKQVPMDLFTGQPLGFRTTKDGLVIYSVGTKGTYDGKALDNLHAIDPTVLRIEFRLWNMDRRCQPPWPEQPKKNQDGPGF
jgi:hypothetical protein